MFERSKTQYPFRAASDPEALPATPAGYDAAYLDMPVSEAYQDPEQAGRPTAGRICRRPYSEQQIWLEIRLADVTGRAK
jgi:hypothetical protein